MKNKIIFNILLVGSIMIQTSCTKDLEQLKPNSTNAEVVFSTEAGYKQSLARVYGAFTITSNSGAGSSDVQSGDPGATDFFRVFWKSQELPTDEAVVAWGDDGIQDFHKMSWTPNLVFLKSLFFRSMLTITLANDYIRQCSDANLSKRNITGADADKVRIYKAEARYIRAYQYWVLMDAFGNPPFVTEDNIIGGASPKQISRADLFVYIENELKALENLLITSKTNEYGRVDKAACWALQARLYLNAAVYTGTAKNSEAATYAKKVIDVPGFTLAGTDYRQLMLADNNTNTSENIWTINYDGIRTQTFGGTTFLTHASIGGSFAANLHGVDFGWGGLRCTKNLPNAFPDVTGTADKRSQFYTSGQNLEINDLTTFTDGYMVTKYRNKTKAGLNGSNVTFVDTDMPIFRLPEMYLIYAEAVLRGATTGNSGDALTYVNAIRTRAYGNVTGNILPNQLTLNFILDERMRELYWEGHRRTDLIRYDRFVESTYLWPWKGGVSAGTGVGAFRKIYPIPASDIEANPNLVQNPNY